jgi:hypothetical protein
MQQREHDEDFERYLKKFQPRAIGPLNMPRQAGRPQLRWLAAAAIMVFAGCVALWYGAHRTIRPAELRSISVVRSGEFRPARRVNTLALTNLALDNSKAFEAVLTDESRNMFPNMQEERSALRVLAKE